jgi:hypothetical protein
MNGEANHDASCSEAIREFGNGVLGLGDSLRKKKGRESA